MDYSIHHRKLRSQGGDNSLANLVALCGGDGGGGCHGQVHAEPAESMRDGWIVSREHEPAMKPISHALYGHVFLTVTGSVSSRRPDLSED